MRSGKKRRKNAREEMKKKDERQMRSRGERGRVYPEVRTINLRKRIQKPSARGYTNSIKNPSPKGERARGEKVG